MVISGDQQVDFKSPADAERWYAQNISERLKPYMPHSVLSGSGAFKLLLGPASYGMFFCNYGKPSCHILGQLPH
jgi:hypothetical protein